MNSQVTLKDVARTARVSETTVSLVVNGKASQRGIIPSTQARVMAAIQQLGYQPDLTSRSRALHQVTPRAVAKPDGISNGRSQIEERAPTPIRQQIGLVLSAASQADSLTLVPIQESALLAEGYHLHIAVIPTDPASARERITRLRDEGSIGLIACPSVYSAVTATVAGACPVIVLWQDAAKAMLAALRPNQSQTTATPAVAPSPPPVIKVPEIISPSSQVDRDLPAMAGSDAARRSASTSGCEDQSIRETPAPTNIEKPISAATPVVTPESIVIPEPVMAEEPPPASEPVTAETLAPETPPAEPIPAPVATPPETSSTPTPPPAEPEAEAPPQSTIPDAPAPEPVVVEEPPPAVSPEPEIQEAQPAATVTTPEPMPEPVIAETPAVIPEVVPEPVVMKEPSPAPAAAPPEPISTPTPPPAESAPEPVVEGPVPTPLVTPPPVIITEPEPVTEADPVTVKETEVMENSTENTPTEDASALNSTAESPPVEPKS